MSILGFVAVIPIVVLLYLSINQFISYSYKSGIGNPSHSTINFQGESFDQSIEKNHNSLSNDSQWMLHGFKQAMKVYKKRMPNTPLLAFRGEVIIPIEMEQVTKAFFNVSHTLKWADKLQYVETLPLVDRMDSRKACSKYYNDDSVNTHQIVPAKRSFFRKTKRLISKFWHLLLHTLRLRSKVQQEIIPEATRVPECISTTHSEDPMHALLSAGKYSDIMYQLYSMWPLSSRDFVFLRKAVYHRSNQSIIIHYTSTTDVRIPPRDNIVRTNSPFTTWTFQRVEAFCNSENGGKSVM